MRCKTCDYRLWNLSSRHCPECGAQFSPSEHDFVPNSVSFHCPHCEKYLKTTADKAGAQAQCPGCGEAITVPGDSAGQYGGEEAGYGAGEFAPEEFAPAVTTGGDTKNCPMCGAEIKASAVKCRFWGEIAVDGAMGRLSEAIEGVDAAIFAHGHGRQVLWHELVHPHLISGPKPALDHGQLLYVVERGTVLCAGGLAGGLPRPEELRDRDTGQEGDDRQNDRQLDDGKASSTHGLLRRNHALKQESSQLEANLQVFIPG